MKETRKHRNIPGNNILQAYVARSSLLEIVLLLYNSWISYEPLVHYIFITCNIYTFFSILRRLGSS